MFGVERRDTDVVAGGAVGCMYNGAVGVPPLLYLHAM